MNDQTPRKGDLALIVGSAEDLAPECIGAVVTVLSDPQTITSETCETREVITHIACEHSAVKTRFGCVVVTPLTNLVRLLPPDEAKHLFADEPIGVEA